MRREATGNKVCVPRLSSPTARPAGVISDHGPVVLDLSLSAAVATDRAVAVLSLNAPEGIRDRCEVQILRARILESPRAVNPLPGTALSCCSPAG